MLCGVLMPLRKSTLCPLMMPRTWSWLSAGAWVSRLWTGISSSPGARPASRSPTFKVRLFHSHTKPLPCWNRSAWHGAGPCPSSRELMRFILVEPAPQALVSPVIQHDVGCCDLPVLDRQDSQPARQLKPLRAGRAGIEEQDGTSALGLWLMRVAEDTDIGPLPVQERLPLAGQLSALIHDVPDGHALPS